MKNFLFLTLFCALAASIRGEVTVSIQQVDIMNNFVLDADAGRDAVRANARVEYLSDPSANGTAEIEFRLLDSEGEATDIYNQNGSAAQVYRHFDSDPLDTVDERTYEALLRPVDRLDPHQVHRVHVRVIYHEEGVGEPPTDEQESSLAILYHFTNTDPNDSALNVIATLDQTSFTQTYLVDTDSGKDELEAEVRFSLRRWDEFTETVMNPPPSNVEVFFEWTLHHEETGAEVPLTESSSSTVVSIAPYSGNFIGENDPAIRTGLTDTFAFAPAEQLDSVDGPYRLTVSISHIDVPGESPVNGNSRESEAEQLLHFNGTLNFGDVETRFTSIANDPDSLSVFVGSIRTTLAVDGGSGHVFGNPGHRYGDGTALSVNLRPDGSADMRAGQDVALNAPAQDIDEVNGVRFEREGVTLAASGGEADLTLIFPSGFGVRDKDNPDSQFSPRVDLGNFPLDGNLKPTSELHYTFDGSAFCAEETKPLLIVTRGFTWDTVSGRIHFDVQGVHYQYENSLSNFEDVADRLVDEHMIVKPSNERYYRFISGFDGMTISADADGGALLDLDLTLGGGDFISHFPQTISPETPDQTKGIRIGWASGSLEIRESRLVRSGSQISGVGPIVGGYRQNCLDEPCGGMEQVAGMEFLPKDGKFFFTENGGLHAAGDLGEPAPLQFGASAPDEYAHETDMFVEASFHMPGHFLPGGLNAVSPEAGAGAVLMAGVDRDGGFLSELPATAAYEMGLADYAGLNFVGADGLGLQGSSRLGDASVSYDMHGGSKYYARLSGISGIHQAAPGGHGNPVIYGYQFGLKTLGFTFLSSNVEESGTGGSIELPHPSAFSQAFEELTLSCLGALEEAKVPEDDRPKSMRYWLAEIDTRGITFAGDPDDCATDERFLTMAVVTQVAHFSTPLAGVLGFKSDGNLLTMADAGGDGPEGIDSRLPLPSTIVLDGPAEEKYHMVPSSDLYYNNYDHYQQSGAGEGFVTFAASVSVPFFTDIQAQVQTWAQADSSTAPIYLIGGWPSEGWRDAVGDHYFTHSEFDAEHVGFPKAGYLEDGSSINIPLAKYQNPNDDTLEPFMPRATQSWLEVIEFDYPLVWNFTTRSFQSYKQLDKDLLLVEVQHQVKYLSADNAELVFGAQYDGLPQLNLSNMLFEAAESQTGAAKAFADAAQEGVRQAVEDGIDGMAGLVNDQMDEVFDEIFDEVIDDLIDDLYGRLESSYATAVGNSDDVVELLEEWETNRTEDLREMIYDATGGVDAVEGELIAVLMQIDDVAGDAQGILDRVTRELSRVENTINALIGQVDVDAWGDPIPDFELDERQVEETLNGLLVRNGAGELELVQNLVRELIRELSPELASVLGGALDELTSDLNQRVNELLEESEPTIDRIVEVLEQVEERVGFFREQIEENGQIVAEFRAIVQDSQSEIETLAEGVRDTVDGFFEQIEANLPSTYANRAVSEVPNPFDEYSADEFKNLLRTEIEDRFYGGQLVTKIQVALKQRLYDVDAALKESIDTTFQQVNTIIKDLISATLAEVESEINGVLGTLSDYVGAGQVAGYAHINGDALRLLRLDGDFQWKVPKELEFSGYLQIKQLDSDGTPGCGGDGEREPFASEVTLGALDIPIGWISPGLRADVETKFSFETGPVRPMGLTGAFELTGGEINFEAFAMTKMAAAVAFGQYENYLSAATSLSFSDYELTGGIYFGRTCTLDPIALWDPEVAAVLGDPPFTGAYVYGDGWIPISEALLGIPATCMFRISAGVGAGAFYFLEGPTYGGKFLAGLSGEALCVVSVKGELKMIGLKQGDDYRFSGSGRVSGKAGSCPFCVKFGKSISATYDGSWDVEM